MLQTIISAILFLAFIINSQLAYAEVPFKPYIIESTDDEICEIALEHYDKLFHSSEIRFPERLNSPQIYYPESFPAEIDFYRMKKIVISVYSTRSGDEHFSTYIIAPEQLDFFKSLHSNERRKNGFQVVTEHYYTASYPFQFNDNWYISSRHNPLLDITQPVNIYRLTNSQEKIKVCSIQVYPTTTFEAHANQLPFSYAYRQSLESILLSPTDCTNSNAPYQSKYGGKSFSVMTIMRPWLLLAEPPSPRTTFDIKYRAELKQQQIQQFYDWQFGEIWSFREYETYDNLKADAAAELTNYFESAFTYSREESIELANIAITKMLKSYYSLGIYHDRSKDFSFLEEILEGRYQNWDNLAEDLQLPYHRTIPLSALSLAIDYPQQLDNLPTSIETPSITTTYGKDLFMYAAHMNQYDTVKYFIDKKWSLDHVTIPSNEFNQCDLIITRANRSALTYAVENASIELINLLIDAGSDIDIIDTEGNNLDFYLQKNPRFTESEKALGLSALIERYRENKFPDVTCDYPTVSDTLKSTICDSKGLSIYERELNQSYEQLLDNTDDHFNDILKNSREDWLQQRDNECSAFAQPYQISACIARTTRARTRYHRYLIDALNP